MKKIIFFIIAILSWTVSMQAANPADAIVDSTVKTYKSSKGISANYIITAAGTQSNGSIAMKGEKFRMISDDVKCWFNGKIQWSYSPMSGEVNITEPTPEELQMINPYSIISGFRHGFNARMLKSATASNHEIELLPKNAKQSDLASVRLTINKKTMLPNKIVFLLKDKTTMMITLNNYKTNQNLPNSTFEFNGGMVPKGTPVVDIR